MDHFDLPSLRDLEHPRTQVVTAAQTADLLRVRRYASCMKCAGTKRSRWDRPRSPRFRWSTGVRVCAAILSWLQRLSDRNRQAPHRLRRRHCLYRCLQASEIIPASGSRHYAHWRVQSLDSRALQSRTSCADGEHAGAEFILPVHHQTFQLSREPKLEPMERALAAVGSATERICLRSIGQEFHLSLITGCGRRRAGRRPLVHRRLALPVCAAGGGSGRRLASSRTK